LGAKRVERPRSGELQIPNNTALLLEAGWTTSAPRIGRRFTR